MTTQPGWYADPSGAPTPRFWDGQQWATTTGFVTVPVLVAAPTGPRSFVDRHPKMVGFGILWIVLMAMHWWWLAPLLIVSVAGFFTAKYYRARNARLATDADVQDSLYARGKPAGTYGRFYQPGVSEAYDSLG